MRAAAVDMPLPAAAARRIVASQSQRLRDGARKRAARHTAAPAARDNPPLVHLRGYHSQEARVRTPHPHTQAPRVRRRCVRAMWWAASLCCVSHPPPASLHRGDAPHRRAALRAAVEPRAPQAGNALEIGALRPMIAGSRDRARKSAQSLGLGPPLFMCGVRKRQIHYHKPGLTHRSCSREFTISEKQIVMIRLSLGGRARQCTQAELRRVHFHRRQGPRRSLGKNGRNEKLEGPRQLPASGEVALRAPDPRSAHLP